MSNTIEFIEQGNKLIADFMGVKIGVDQYSWRVGCSEPLKEEHLNYHASWGWLMPVVEKIQKEGKDGHLVSINLYSKGEGFACECKIYNWGLGEPEQEAECASAIEAIWQAVIQFIEWYNNQKSNQ